MATVLLALPVLPEGHLVIAQVHYVLGLSPQPPPALLHLFVLSSPLFTMRLPDITSGVGRVRAEEGRLRCRLRGTLSTLSA